MEANDAEHAIHSNAQIAFLTTENQQLTTKNKPERRMMENTLVTQPRKSPACLTTNN
jgi:hypothetical protein